MSQAGTDPRRPTLPAQQNIPMKWVVGTLVGLAVITLLAFAISSSQHSKLEGRWSSGGLVPITIVVHHDGAASVGFIRATWVKSGPRSIRIEKLREKPDESEEGGSWVFGVDLSVEFRLGKDDNEALVSAIGRDWRFERQP